MTFDMFSTSFRDSPLATCIREDYAPVFSQMIASCFTPRVLAAFRGAYTIDIQRPC